MKNKTPFTDTLFDLTDKCALLTAATSGMGLAMAHALGQAGAKLVINGFDKAQTQEAVKQLSDKGYAVKGITCDVSSKANVETLFAQALNFMGKIDILICNAGIAPPPGSMQDITEEMWQKTQQLNLQSPHWLSSLAIPGMAKRQDGVVIFTASLSSVRGNKYLGLYGITKAGVVQMARNLAVEWGPQNIRVNAISPGVIRSGFASPLIGDPAAIAKRTNSTPLRRIGEPDEIAGVVLMLASKAGGFITGQNIIIDGGTIINDGN